MRYRRRRRIQIQTSSANAAQMMSLSLFIMLLAFFIVLNAISTFEKNKSEQVQQSLVQVFSSDVQQQDVKPSLVEDIAQSVKEGHVFDRLDALFQTQLISFEKTQSKSRGVMSVKMPYTEFTKAMKAVDQKDLTKMPTRLEGHRNYFLPTLVSLMQTDIGGAPTRMEIYFHVRGNPAEMQNKNPTALKKVIEDVGQYSALLQGARMPQKLLNIGVSKGDPDEVTLVFRKYKPFSPVKPPVEVTP